MQHNRKLCISTAGSRKAVHWQKNEVLWSEFVERLKTPIRGTETQEQYLAMTKAQQAELKDVGGRDVHRGQAEGRMRGGAGPRHAGPGQHTRRSDG